jgi:hypothetical protein
MNSIIVATIVILFFSIPFVVMLFMNRDPKQNDLPKACQKAILGCPHRLSIKHKKNEIIYTYTKNNQYGSVSTIERFFDDGVYRGTINITKSIEDAMQIRIDQVEEVLPDAVVDIIYPEDV